MDFYAKNNKFRFAKNKIKGGAISIQNEDKPIEGNEGVPVGGPGPEGSWPAPGCDLLLAVGVGVRGREPGGRLLPTLVGDHQAGLINSTPS